MGRSRMEGVRFTGAQVNRKTDHHSRRNIPGIPDETLNGCTHRKSGNERELGQAHTARKHQLAEGENHMDTQAHERLGKRERR